MKMGWRLGMILVLFGAGAAVLHLAPPVKAAVDPALLFALPMTLGEWSGGDGVPDEILPRDPSEKLSIRRTYRGAGHVAWVSVSLFAAQDEEARRGSVNKIYPQRSVSLIEAVPLTARVGAPSVSPVTLPAVIVHHGSSLLLVAYWHQIDNRVYGNEYGFRLALMRDLIFARRADTLLVRIALPVRPDGGARESLDAAGPLAASLYAALASEGRR